MKCRRIVNKDGKLTVVWFGSYGTNTTAVVTLEEKKVGLYDNADKRLIDINGVYLFAKEEH